MQVINESSIRQLVASDVLNRLRADQEKAQLAVEQAQRNRTQAEDALRKFFRFTWNQGAIQSQQEKEKNKEELDAKLGQLRADVAQASEELRQAQVRLQTLAQARQQHEADEAATMSNQDGTNNNNSQQQGRGVYDDDRNGNLMNMRSNNNNNGRNFNNPNIVSNQQQLDELHARAAGTSLLMSSSSNNNNQNQNHNHNNTKKKLIAPTVGTASQQYHGNNNNNNNNKPENLFGSYQPLINPTIAEDYEGGELVPPSSRVHAGNNDDDDDGNDNKKNKKNNKKKKNDEFSPTKVLATSLQRQKKKSGKRRSRLENIAESDEDEDYDNNDDDENNNNNNNMMMMGTTTTTGNQQNKKKKTNIIKKEPGVTVKKEEYNSSSSSDDDDSSTSSSSFFSSDDEDLDEKVAQTLQPSADDLIPIRIIDNDDYYLPKYVWTSLLGYQQDAMRWFCGLHRRRVGGIEGDEMGLGKTVMLSSFIHCLRFSGKLVGPVLIVAPLTVLAQWKREAQKWCSNMEVAVLHSMDLTTNTSSNKKKNTTRKRRTGTKVKKEEGAEDDDDNDSDDDEQDLLLGNDDDDDDGLILGAKKGSSSANLQAILRDQVRGKNNVIGLTTYNTLAKNIEAFISCNFDVVALDEGHKIANPEAGLTIAAKSLPTTHRYILSGSPIQNSLIEIWSLFDFCCPGLLGGATSFVSAFEDPIKASRNPHATPLQLATAVECARALRDQITPFLLRRLKKDVNKMLPRKVEKAVLCPLTDAQLQSYVDILASSEARAVERQHFTTQQELAGLDRHGREKATGSLNLLGVNRHRSMRGLMHRCWELLADLRSICNHVDIFKVRSAHRAEKNENALAAGNDDLLLLRAGIDNNGNQNQNNNQNTNTNNGKKKTTKKKSTNTNLSFRSNNPVDFTGSSKLTALMELLDQWQPDGHKVLIFCQTRMMLDIIENAVSQKQYRYIRMDGTTAGVSRHDLVHKFNQDPSIYCALLTTRVGGLGLNLTGADRVVLFDPDWNPVVDEQARERAWRIGQQREVHVYRLICSGTIEEHILHRQMAKMFVTEKVLSDPTLQRFFSIHSLVDAFRLGSEYTDRVAEACHGTIISNAISIRPSIKQELKQGMSTTTTNSDNNNNSQNKNVLQSSNARIVQDEHAQSAPERVSMNSGSSNERYGSTSNHPSYYNNNNNTNYSNGRSVSMASTQLQYSQGNNNSSIYYQQDDGNADDNNNNNNNMMMMMGNNNNTNQNLTRTLELDDGRQQQQNNNNSNGNGTSSGGDTGVLSAMVDGTKDEDGVMQRFDTQTSIAARRLAQLSALTTLKKALSSTTTTGSRNNNHHNNNNNNSQQRRR